MLLIIGPTGVLTCLRSKLPRMHLIRALFLFIANFAFMAALRYLPLTEANVVGFVSPLLLTALTYPVLGEKVGFGRWVAVAAGFVGVLIVMQPGTALFQWPVLLPLVMAMCAASYHVMTPIVARVEDPAISIVFLGVIGATCMSVVVPFSWADPDTLGWVDAMRDRRARDVRASAHRPCLRTCAGIDARALFLRLSCLGDDLRLARLRQYPKTRNDHWRCLHHRERHLRLPKWQ